MSIPAAPPPPPGNNPSGHSQPSPPPATPLLAPASAGASTLNWKEIRLKCIKWFFFEIAFALLPLVFAWKEFMLKDGKATWLAVLGRGELLLVAVAVTAAGVGEILIKGLHGRMRSLKIGLIGFGMLMMVSAANFYGDLAGPADRIGEWAKSLTVPTSLTAVFAAIILNLASIIISEVH
ncbi:hypothetical protein [Actinoplanes sp. NBRC 101535]|uniref:hypothetical protein n=1 Tax=Actinoplanes sp. NBRC 101535 TaxID=3032196 RepID=UPI00249FB4CB|nr:hypothetical protein [Actinoplanes sp. NBRC 101535]GLY07055.1 hypothetical protein Acsp01_74340 [Actinoplanes sp. NBRC 101535]